MSVTFNWVEIQDWDLVNLCSISGAICIQGEAFGCLSVWI